MSVLVFSIVAGVTTVAAGRSQLALSAGRLEREARSVLSSLVSQVTTTPYPSLVAGIFQRPLPCASDQFKSCPQVLDRELEVSWSVAAGPDQLGISTENPASLELTASAVLPGGRSVSSSRVVVSPGGGSVGGLLRVRIAGEEYTGPVFLVDGTGAVVSSSVAAGDEVVMRAPVESCTVAEPCRLALSADGGTRNGELTLDAANASGERGGITLSNYSVTEASAVVLPVTPVHVVLDAWSPEGLYARARELGSVCLWFTFQAAGRTESVPACNTESADRVVLRTYRPDPARPEAEVALPQNTNIKVTVDRPDGTCPRVEDAVGLSPDGSGWSSTHAACTSHTWGLPSLWGPLGANGASVPFADASFRLTTSAPRFFAATWAVAEDRALTFATNSVQGMVLLPSSGSTPFTTSAGEASVEVRFTATATAVRQVLFEEGGTSAGLNVYLYAGRLYAGAWTIGWEDDLLVSTPISAGTEHHVVVTLGNSARDLKLYVDGELAGTDTKLTGQVLGLRSDRAALGAVAGTTRFPDTGAANTGPTAFEGTVAELVRYDRALAADEVVAHLAAAGAGSEIGRQAVIAARPAAFYRFEELQGPVLRDGSGNGRHAVLSGPGANLARAGTSSLWGLWRLEGTGERAGRDWSGNARDLTIGPGVLFAAAGRSGQAADLDGSSSVTGTPVFVPAGGTTVECWVFITAATAGPCVRIGGGTNGFSVGVGQGSYSAPGLTITGQIPGYGWLAGQAAVPVNTWSHLALVVDGASASLHLNGSPAGTFNGVVVLPPTAGVHIGANTGSDQAPGARLRGLVDEVAVHTAALSPAEILLRAAASPALGGVGADAGFPATGHSGQAPWSYPRLAGVCAATATCSAVTVAPEAVLCPAAQCLSRPSAPPLLTSPRRGGYQLPAAAALAAAVVTVGVDDPDGDRITAAVASGGIRGGTLTLAGSPVAAGQVIAAGLTGPATLPPLTFTPSPGWSSGSVDLVLSDATGSTRTTIHFSPSSEATYAATIFAAPVQVRQGGSAMGDLVVVGDDGDGFDAAGLALTLPAGATSAEPVSGGGGVFVASYGGGTAAAALHTAAAGSSPTSSDFRFEVLSAAGSVTVSVPDLRQGESAAATVRVTDGAGAPVPGIGAWLTVEDLDGGPAPGLYAEVNGCSTGPSGSCQIVLTAEEGARSGNYSLTAISGSASGSLEFALLQRPDRIEIGGATVEQGMSAEVTAAVFDGADEPVAGVPLLLTGLIDGMGASPIDVTDNSGRTTIVVSADTQTLPGTYTLSLSDGSAAEAPLKVTVTSRVASIVVDPTAITQGGVADITLTALDPQGYPVEGAVLAIEGSGPLLAASRITTDARGDAVLALRVGNTVATGTYELPVRYRDIPVGTVVVEVRAGVSSIVATGNLVRGEASMLTVRMRDAVNMPVSGLTFSVTVDEQIATPAQSIVTTDERGAASVTLTVDEDVSPGLYTVKVRVDGRWMRVGVVVR